MRIPILLVEGNDDEQVIYQLCNHHEYENRERFTVDVTDGYTNLRKQLRVRPKTGNHNILAAVVDADEGIEQRWQSISDALAKAGYDTIPDEPSIEGTILQSVGILPRLGVWLMPNNKDEGILEDFLQSLANEDDALFEKARESVDDIPQEARLFKNTYLSKAYIHTWLAWQEEPGTPLGLGITKKYLDGDAPTAVAFMNWLRTTFEAGEE